LKFKMKESREQLEIIVPNKISNNPNNLRISKQNTIKILMCCN